MNTSNPIAPRSEHSRQAPVLPPRLGAEVAASATVFVVDDDAAVRQTLQVLMESSGYRAECFASAEEFQEVFDAVRPDCVVLDVSLPGMSGLALLEELRRQGKTTPVILFSASDDATLASRALLAGARDYCAKSRGLVPLLASVREAIWSGRRLPQPPDQVREPSLRIHELTPREREILELLASGRRNHEIAVLLGISAKTVSTHRSSLLRKTRSDSLATLTTLWQEYKASH